MTRARDAAALVAAARDRADALPGALPRCPSCGKPAAGCADTACMTRCPEDGHPLRLDSSGHLACPSEYCDWGES